MCFIACTVLCKYSNVRCIRLIWADVGRHTCCYWNTNRSGQNKYYDASFGDNMWDYVFDPVDKGKGKYRPAPPKTTDMFMIDKDSRWVLHHEDPRSIYLYYYGEHEGKRKFDLFDDVFFAKQRVKAWYIVRKYLTPKKYVLDEVATIISQIREGASGGKLHRSAVPAANPLDAPLREYAANDGAFGQPSLVADQRKDPGALESWFLAWNKVYSFKQYKQNDPKTLRTRAATQKELTNHWTDKRVEALPVTRTKFKQLQARDYTPKCSQQTKRKDNPTIRKQNDRRPILGVHMRGTDKQAEIGGHMVQPAEYMPYIKRYLKLNPNALVYVATDSPHFLQEVHSSLPQAHFISSERNENNAFLDETIESRARLAADVLIDALILSHCDFLLYTNSAVSEYAIYFNPRLHDRSVNIQYNFSTMTQMSAGRGAARVDVASAMHSWPGLFDHIAPSSAEIEYPILFDGFGAGSGKWINVNAPALMQPFSVSTPLAFEMKAAPPTSRPLNVMIYNMFTCGVNFSSQRFRLLYVAMTAIIALPKSHILAGADLFFARGQPFLEFDACDMPVRLWFGPDYKETMLDEMDVVVIPLGWETFPPAEVLGKTDDLLPKLKNKRTGQTWVGCSLENGQSYFTTPWRTLQALGVDHMASFSQIASVPMSFYSSFYIGKESIRTGLRAPTTTKKKPFIALMQAACAKKAEEINNPVRTSWRDAFLKTFMEYFKHLVHTHACTQPHMHEYLHFPAPHHPAPHCIASQHIAS